MGASASVSDFSSISDSTLRDKIIHVQKLYYKEDKKDAAMSECYNLCATYYKDPLIISEEYQFLEFLITVIQAPNHKSTRSHALNGYYFYCYYCYSYETSYNISGLMWMSLHPPNSTRLCSFELKLVSTLIATMNDSVPDRLNAAKVLGNICKI